MTHAFGWFGISKSAGGSAHRRLCRHVGAHSAGAKPLIGGEAMHRPGWLAPSWPANPASVPAPSKVAYAAMVRTTRMRIGVFLKPPDAFRLEETLRAAQPTARHARCDRPSLHRGPRHRRRAARYTSSRDAVAARSDGTFHALASRTCFLRCAVLLMALANERAEGGPGLKIAWLAPLQAAAMTCRSSGNSRVRWLVAGTDRANRAKNRVWR